MKLRWIDTKSKQMREVCIDLDAIINSRARSEQSTNSHLTVLLPPSANPVNVSAVSETLAHASRVSRSQCGRPSARQ